MRNQLVYDLPMRGFHLFFAGIFVTTFIIAKTIDDESPTYSYHMLAGFLLGFTVLLRILWGVIGTKNSRFVSFALHPKELMAYFLGILSGSKQKWAGHNPASSWAALTMFGLALGLGFTGYLMASGQKETFEDIHEVMANGFLVVVLLHITGVVLHTLRFKDGIALSMVDGKKKDIPDAETISSSRPGIALLFVGLVLTFATFLGSQYDSENQTLNLFGTVLQLGENEGTEQGESRETDQNDEEDEDGESGDND